MFGKTNWGNTSQTIQNQLIGRPAGNAFGGGFTNQLPQQQPPPGNGVAMGGGAFRSGGAQMSPQQMAFMGNKSQQEFGITQGNPGMGMAGGMNGGAIAAPQSGMNRPMQNSPMAPMPNGPMGGGKFSPMAPAGQPPQQYSPMAPAQRPPMGLFGFRGS